MISEVEVTSEIWFCILKNVKKERSLRDFSNRLKNNVKKVLKINEMVTNSFFIFFFNQKSVKNNTGNVV